MPCKSLQKLSAKLDGKLSNSEMKGPGQQKSTVNDNVEIKII
jgi:hypothetical protein